MTREIFDEWHALGQYLQVDFSPEILFYIYQEQFRQKHKRARTLRESDCVFQKLNDYLEAATCHFRHQGGGRWKGQHY